MFDVIGTEDAHPLTIAYSTLPLCFHMDEGAYESTATLYQVGWIYVMYIISITDNVSWIYEGFLALPSSVQSNSVDTSSCLIISHFVGYT